MTKNIKEILNEIVIFPPKHFISSEPQREQAIKEIKKELKERLKFFKERKMYLEAERLGRRTLYDMEMLKTIGYCHGIENYSRHLAGKLAGDPPDTLLAYFPTGKFLTIIDESHIAIPQIRGMYEGDQARKNILVQYGWRLPSALDNRPLKFTEFEKQVGQVICTSATPGEWEIKRSNESASRLRRSDKKSEVGAPTFSSVGVVEQIIRPTGLIDPPVEVRPVFDKKTNKSQVDDLVAELKKIVKKKERAIVNVLTKKMAEDFSDFLAKAGFKVRWMHSDTKTLERAEILTNFRKGIFSVLVGVNLLRGGLDLPEVTLVAILDADREGFLRSETSLIQTMGRTSRNIDGKVILYADNITGSLKRAMSEAERRRKIQIIYNKKHGITPRSIIKKIEGLLDLEK